MASLVFSSSCTSLASPWRSNVQVQPLEPRVSGLWTLAPGDTIAIPLDAIACESISITTNGPTGKVWDTLLVLLAPDGKPVASADDAIGYYAALNWTAPVAGTYENAMVIFPPPFFYHPLDDSRPIDCIST